VALSKRRVAAIAAAAVVLAVATAFVVNGRVKDAAVDHCIDVLGSSRSIEDPYARGVAMSDACAALYAERGCREAFAHAWAKDTDPSQRSRIMAEGCRDAYCPKLAAPKPAMCDEAEPNLITAQTTWPEFVRTVLVRDLGEERADRVLAAMKAASKQPH
jgi:hypothetical protein